MGSVKREGLYRTWGEYYGYPQCCIDDFCSETRVRTNTIFYGSGFCPCPTCSVIIEGVGVEEASSLLGIRNPFLGKGDILSVYHRTKTTKFRDIARSHKFNTVDYLQQLEWYLSV